MGEPFAFYATEDQLGLPAPWQAQLAREEARALAREQREAAERRERAEDRRDQALYRAAMQALAEGREGVDLNDPSTYVLSGEELAARVFAEQDREAARADFKAAVDAGLLHVLNIPPDEMGPPPPPSDAELEAKRADLELERKRRRSERAGVVAKARRALARIGRPA